MDTTVKELLLYGGGAVVSLIVLKYIVKIVATGKEAVGAVNTAVDRVISDPLATFAAGYIVRQPSIVASGRVFLFPTGPTILVNDIVAEGSSIKMRADGVYEFRYRSASYVLDTQISEDGTRIARRIPTATTPK